MYIYLEDFTDTTYTNPRSSKFFAEARRYGAQSCACPDECDWCQMDDKRMVLLRLAHWCRQRMRFGSYVHTETRTVSSSVWPGPYTQWCALQQRDVQSVYEEAWTAYEATDWFTVRLPPCCVADRRQDRFRHDAQWFSSGQLRRSEFVARLRSKHPQCRAVYQPVKIADLKQQYRLADTADLRREEEELVSSHWRSFTINALGVKIQSATHIAISLPFCPSLAAWLPATDAQNISMDVHNLANVAKVVAQAAYVQLSGTSSKAGVELTMEVRHHKKSVMELEDQRQLLLEKCRSDRPAFVCSRIPTDGISDDEEQVMYTYCPMGLARQHDEQRSILSQGSSPSVPKSMPCICFSVSGVQHMSVIDCGRSEMCEYTFFQ